MNPKTKKIKLPIKINLINTKKWYKKVSKNLGMILLSHNPLFNKYQNQLKKKKPKNKSNNKKKMKNYFQNKNKITKIKTKSIKKSKKLKQSKPQNYLKKIKNMSPLHQNQIKHVSTLQTFLIISQNKKSKNNTANLEMLSKLKYLNNMMELLKDMLLLLMNYHKKP